MEAELPPGKHTGSQTVSEVYTISASQWAHPDANFGRVCCQSGDSQLATPYIAFRRLSTLDAVLCIL